MNSANTESGVFSKKPVLHLPVFNESGGNDIFVAGNDPRTIKVLRTLSAVAPTDSTILINGASGTGKDLIARLVHQTSKRREGPWVPVNCGAIPGSLIESELFGALKGAYTGIDRDKQGLIEKANGGTLFLDEIGELPIEAQVKLLRVLQSGRIRAVGSNEDRSVDVRIIAATNLDLRQEVKAGRFRLDLFYRIHVVHVELAPLREREFEFPHIVESVLERLRNKEIDVPPLKSSAIEVLIQHTWPGNIRELENVLERAVLLTTGGEIDGDTIREQIASSPVSEDEVKTVADREVGGYSVSMSLKEVEDAHIQKVLNHHGGNKTRAARDLGVNVKTVYNRTIGRERKEDLSSEVNED
ncbi:MAG: sigma-54-dependent Fis family transcriptional regulator [Planctomycetes bacterium]|nr:sigma-54-dependent Fis family transcriptional regulator [Planctomycetota bacterium]